MRKLLVLLVLVSAFASAYAQTPAATKIGFANVAYIYSKMPESKQVENELAATEKQLKTQLEAKMREFQTKLQDYNANVNNMLDAVRANTERELNQLQENLQQLQQDAQTTIQNKHAQLMEPVYEKVGNAIAEVAKENGYTFILSEQIGGLDVVLYASDSSDVSDLVLKKMGVDVAAAEPKPQN